MNFAAASRALLEHPIKSIDYKPADKEAHAWITFNLENGDVVTIIATPKGERVAGFHFKVNRA